MTILFQYVEKCIFHVEWIKRVTIEEIEFGVMQIRQQVDERGDPAYVEIIDLRECKVIPWDLRGLRRVATTDPRIVGYVILNPNTLAKTMANMLVQVTRLPFRMTSSLDEALAAARLMVNERLTTNA
jgi:hypothetical protein